MNDQNFKNLCLKDFFFVKFQNAQTNIMKSTNFFLVLFYTVPREDALTDKATVKS